MAIYLGVIVGGFGGFVAEHPQLGWRLAFNACGLIGVIYSVPLFLLLRDRRGTDGSRAAAGGVLESVRELLSNGSFILLVLYFTLPALAGWVVRDWMPAIFQDQFHLTQGRAGVWATLPWQLAAIVGAGVGGWLADRWMDQTQRGRIYVSAIGMALIIPGIFGVGNAGTLTMAIALLSLFGIGWGFFDSNNMPLLAQITRPGLRATGYGIMNLVSISCGGLADWGFGVLRDQRVPLNRIFGIFAAIALVSLVIVLLIRPRPETLESVD